MKSLKELPGSAGLLLSTSRPAKLPSEISWKKITPMNHRQYSIFMMFNLHNFIQSEFALIVQDDGWVVNGGQWRDEYLDYDYIGALSHAAIVNDTFYQNFSWVSLNNPRIIQNGGFSLRSHRFLVAPSLNGASYYFSDKEPLFNEDVQLSGIYRPQLEELGIKFSPNELCNKFSLEYLGPIIHDGINFSEIFGTHGSSRKLISENSIQISKSLDSISHQYREIEYLGYLRSIGYQIFFNK